MDVDTVFLHIAEETAAYRPASHIVEQHPHLYASLYGGDKFVADLAAEAVVAENKILHVDEVLGIAKVVDEVGKLFPPLCVHAHIVAGIVVGVAEFLAHGEQPATVFADGELLQIDFRRLVAGLQQKSVLLGEHAFVAEALPEKEVENQTYDGQEHERKNPCKTLGGIAILRNDNKDTTRYKEQV